MKIIHLSDLHFGPYHTSVALEGIRSFMMSHQRHKPDVIVISGDFTQRAKIDQYRKAKIFLESLASIAPTVVTPGNHDIPLYRIFERIFFPYYLYRRWIRSERDYYLELPSKQWESIGIVSLDSTAPYRRIDGHITKQQLLFCQRVLSESNPQIKVLVTHHPLIFSKDIARKPAIFCHQRRLQQLSQLGFKIILSGHLHQSCVTNWNPLTGEICAPESREQSKIVNVLSGTASSSRGRFREYERCSFNVLELHTPTESNDSILQVDNYSSELSTGNFQLAQSYRCILPA